MSMTLSRANTVVALGSLDPEMYSIQTMLRGKGYRTAFAQRFRKRCVSGNAYLAENLSWAPGEHDQIVWVECRSTSYQTGRDLIVDHHNEGDPGYSAPPSEYWEGSSIGQIANMVGAKQADYKFVAAGDHCLSAAMRGECAGINPKELMSWRISARAAMARIQPWVLRRRIDRASERLQVLPRLNLGGTQVIDGSFEKTPELRDAAALAGVPILTTRITPSGQLKVGLYGAEPDLVTDWLNSMRASGFVDHTYGNPFREFAGALLDLATSERLITASRR